MIFVLIGLLSLIFIKQKISLIFLLFIYFIYLIYKNKKLALLSLIGLSLGLISVNITPQYNPNQHIFTGYIYQSKDNYFLLKCQGNNYYIYQENHDYEIFDCLKIEGELKKIDFPCLEGQFNFTEYLYNLKVEQEIIVNKIEIKFQNLIRKKKIKRLILSNYNEISKELISFFFFNESNSHIAKSLYYIGIGSYFSLNGLQVFFLYYLFQKILLYLTNKKRFSEIFSFCLLIPFLSFSNYKLSFIKAFILLIFKVFNIKLLSNSQINTIFLVFILLINFRYAYTTSFLYLFILPIIYNWLVSGIESFELKNQKNMKMIFFALLIGIFNLFENGQYNFMSLLIMPLTLIVSHLYFLIAIISLIVPVHFLVNLFSEIINYSLEFLITIPSIRFLDKNNYVFLIISFLIFFFIKYFSQLRLKKLLTFSILFNYLIVLLFTSSIDSITSQYVYFINVGQGDCALIHNRNYNVLIDTGGSLNIDIANEVLYPFFQRKHIKSIDCLFISHEDFDHNGAQDELIGLMNVKEVVIGSNFYKKIIGDINFYNLNQFSRGSEDNINSSVIFFDFIGKKFLFMGDAPILIEKKIINTYPYLTADIIKIGHHGSKTSSDYNFLKMVNPQEAVISVGKNNQYNHPDDIVIKYLIDLNIKIRRTDYEGSVKYYK